MAGTFLIGETKIRPGVYYRREKIGATASGATNGVLAALFQSNWGELNKVVSVDQTQMNELDDIFGDGATIIREGLLGGAKTVLAIRVGSDDGLVGKVILKSTPTVVDEQTVSTDLVELSALHVGERNFTVSVRTNLITDKRQLLIYSGTDIYATVNFDAGTDEAQNLVDALSGSKIFTARKLNSGQLADVTQAALTGGKNPTVTTSNYEHGTNALERFRWNCIVADSDGAEVNGILTAFVKQSYETGHLGFACIGGKSSQTLDERMSFAAACNDEKIVFVLNGWKSTDGTIYEGWRASARIGGMIAGVETNSSLTHNVISNALELIEPLTNGEVIRAEQKGCLVLSLNYNDQIQIDNAINTLVTPDSNCDDGWKKIRRVKTRFEVVDRINATCEPLIGRVNNDSNGRGTIVTVAQGVINEMVAESKLFEGSRISEDESHKPDGDSAYFVLTIGDVDSVEKLYLTFRFSYSNPFEG